MSRLRRLLPTLLLPVLIIACSPGGGPGTPDVSLQGVVTDSGVPVAATLALHPADDAAGAVRTATSNAAGEYAFSNVPAGTYNLLVTTADDRGAFRAGISVSGTPPVTVNVEVTALGGISGVAILEGRPADSAGIEVSVPGTGFSTTTNAAGEFALPSVPAGTYTLSAEAPGYDTETVEGIVVNSGATTDLPATITLAPEEGALSAYFTLTQDRDTVSVDASGTAAPAGAAVSYDWQFGDGATASGVTAEHTYTSTGTMTITLTVTDDAGGSSTFSRDLEVLALVEEVVANIFPDVALANVTLEPNETAYFDVLLDSGEAEFGTAFYVELSADLNLQTTWDGVDLYSASREYFSTNPATLTGSAHLAPAAIGVAVECRGSCVIVNPAIGTAQVSITNTSGAGVSFDLFGYIEDLQDSNEPQNDTVSGAVQLVKTFSDEGAIETVGDVDHYEMTELGIFTFTSEGIVEVVATVLDNDGVYARGPFRSGATITVQPGEFVQMHAYRPDRASASANSSYTVTLN